MSSSPTTHAPYPVRVLLAAAATVALSFGGLTFASAAADQGGKCVPKDADGVTTYIEHAAVYRTVHVEATYKTVVIEAAYVQHYSWTGGRLDTDNPPVSYTHLRAHETDSYLVCRLLLEK